MSRKSLVIHTLTAASVIMLVFGNILVPQVAADSNGASPVEVQATKISENGHMVACNTDKSDYAVTKTMKVVVTAYSSTPDQTDDTPFITAAGTKVRDGVIAINGLKFGTKVKIPTLFGNKVFVVEDRMHPRMGTQHVDVWFASRSAAQDFGKRMATIEILEG